MVPDFIEEWRSRCFGAGESSAVGFFDFGGLIPHLFHIDGRRFTALTSEPGTLLGVQDAIAYLGRTTTWVTVMKTLAGIEAEAARLSECIVAPGSAYPTFGYSADFARPYIEAGGSQYHYVAVERGMKVFRKSTPDLDELLYWVLDGVTFSMACAYESEHCIPGQDFRRLMSSK